MIQIELANWPPYLNDSAIMICLEPHEIHEKCGLIFNQSFDSLDYYHGCVVRFNTGQIFGLIRHFNNPVSGTVIVFEENNGDTRGYLERGRILFNAIGITESQVSWVKGIR